MPDTVELRELIEEKIRGLNAKVDTFIQHAADKFASQNEFRGALSDQTNTLLPRSEYVIQHKAIIDRVDLNIERITQLEANSSGRLSGISSIGGLILGTLALISTLSAAATVIITLIHR